MQDQAIWIIDDDTDDQELVREACRDLNLTNELVFLTSANEVLQRLKEETMTPFIIICDVNLPQTDGFTLREKILGDTTKALRSVPFIFWSTVASEQQISRAYQLAAHGFFIKESSFKELKASFTNILAYWQKSKMPDKGYH